MLVIHGALQMLASILETEYRESDPWTCTDRRSSFVTFFSSVRFSWIHTLVMRRVLHGDLTGEAQCGRGSPLCRRCVVSCVKCCAEGHSEDTVFQAVRKETPAHFDCTQNYEEATHDRMMQKTLPHAHAQQGVAQAAQ